MIHFLFPIGLVSLASLAAVVVLYFYVFRGRRIEVSALFLWGAGQALRSEGRKWRRPPLTWPLVLELIAAALLSLAIAQLVFTQTTERRHAVVVLDSSASMNAGSGPDSFRESAKAKVLGVCRQLGEGGRVSIVTSGYGGQLLGANSLTASEAAAALADWRPADPPHAFGPAIELARSLIGQTERVVLVTDRKVAAPAAIVLGVGRPLENSGWIATHWASDSELFALVKHFGTTKLAVAVTVLGDGVPISRTEVDFAAHDTVPLVFKIPPGVRTVTAALPKDALPNDDTLHVTRPAPPVVRARIDLPQKPLEEQLVKALAATGKARILPDGDAPLRFAMESVPPGPPASAAFEVRFHAVPAAAARAYVGPYFVVDTHPLLRGVDLHGVIWAADETFRPATGTVLVSAGDVPLAVLDGDRLTLNLEPDRTNLFRAPAWPVLVSNLVDVVHDRSPGLKRFSYRLGESLSFSRPPDWAGAIEIAAPGARRIAFKGDRVYYGRLETDGIYEVFASGNRVAAVDANLLAEDESDLTAAASFGDPGEVKASLVAESRRRPFDRELMLAVAAALLGCWFLIERGRP